MRPRKIRIVEEADTMNFSKAKRHKALNRHRCSWCWRRLRDARGFFGEQEHN
jgi:hypothetical protein